MLDLCVNFAGIRHKNPIVAAAGHITHEPVNLKKCIEAGASAVTLKSISLDEETWARPRPCHHFLDKYGYRGALMHEELGFLTPELAVKYIKEIKPLAKDEGTIVVGNIVLGEWSAKSVDEDKNLRDIAWRLQDAGADAIEVPNTCGALISASDRVPRLKREIPLIINTLKGKLEVPFWIKMAFLYDSISIEDLKTIESMGLDAIHIYPEIRSTLIDVETGKPPVSMAYINGTKTAESCYITYATRINTNLKIISSRGVWTWRDVVERIMCGATLVGIHTAVQYNGYKVFKEMISGLKSFMERKGYKKVEDFIGIATPHICNLEEAFKTLKKRQVAIESVEISIDSVKCNGCERCVVCNQGAITMKDGIAQVDLELCNRCGSCASICPQEAITLKVLGQPWMA